MHIFYLMNINVDGISICIDLAISMGRDKDFYSNIIACNACNSLDQCRWSLQVPTRLRNVYSNFTNANDGLQSRFLSSREVDAVRRHFNLFEA